MKKIRIQDVMTAHQAKKMVGFHQRHYKVYKTLGHTDQAKTARKLMLQMYLKFRSLR